MGNKQVKLALRLDEKAHVAGNVVTGKVYLNAGQDYQADALHLLLIGEEYSVVAEDESLDYHSSHCRNYSDQHREIERSSSVLVHMDVPLTHFPSSKVCPGQYEFPFEWELPSNLPSSMYCAKNDSHCEIGYRLTAYLHQKQALGDPEHSSTESLCISARSTQPQANTGVVVDPEIFRIKACCWNQGEVTLGWNVDKTVVSPDSLMKIGITGANDSQVEVECLRACLVETISWSAHGKAKETKRTVAEAKVSASNLPLWHPVSHRYNSYSSVPADHLEQSRVLTQLLLPHDARDTYSGGLIQVRHSLTITAETQPCITAPESSILVRVQRKSSGAVAHAVENAPPVTAPPTTPIDGEPAFVEADLLPDDWRPQEAHVVTLPANSAVLLDSDYVPPPVSAPDETLLDESRVIASVLSKLKASVSESDDPVVTVSRHLNDPMMVTTIQNLTPREFVEVLQSARRDLPSLARLVAGTMDPHFECRHMLACLWCLPNPVRLDVIKEVAPLASDLETQRSIVERELDSNELRHFRAALA